VIQVLFVDDDAAVLDDLRNMMLLVGANWDIRLATNGGDALKHLENGIFDVVVADLKMPGMDGAELLAIVRDQYPDAMRILMSGNADLTFTARLVPQAHQFLHKPCQPSLVKAVVERAYELGQRLADSELRRTLGTITELPRPPQSVLRLNALLDSPDTDVHDIAEVVEQDMALTVKLFQLVNSAYYGLQRNVRDIREAIAYLGLNAVRNLAVSVEVFRSLSATAGEDLQAVQELHERANQVANVAKKLVLDRDQANEAFVAGLLHDVGLLALVSCLPDRYRELRDAAQLSNLPLWDIETEVIGASHADLGAYLLNLWGLPFPVVEAVARHHDAMLLPQRKMDATHAVCIADAIVSATRSGKSLRESNEAGLDTAYLEELGVLERVAGLLAVGAQS
jgi:HD-like signal output (HDOD) protein